MRIWLRFCLFIIWYFSIGLCEQSVSAADWPMLGGNAARNAVSKEQQPPLDWSVGTYDETTHKWNHEKTRNVRWKAKLGRKTFGTPIVAGGKVFIATNGSGGHVERDPNRNRRGYLLCFRESDGKFLWHFSANELETHDWHFTHPGLGASPLVEGNRLWFVSNRGEVICLDTEGFHDGENDGPFGGETESKEVADVVWRYDLVKKQNVFPYSLYCGTYIRHCSPASYRDRLFVVTGNGTEQQGRKIPSPEAPSLVCLDKQTGKVLWTDASPGRNVLTGQFSDPLVIEAGGRAQVVVGQGDGWVRSFDPLTGELIWEFDINPKKSEWIWTRGFNPFGTRNSIFATPVFYDGRVYVGSGRDPEYGDGAGRFVCIDPTKTGDISSELAVDANRTVLPRRRYQAILRERGERAIPNPNSGLLWDFARADQDQDGKVDFHEEFHSTVSSVAVKDDLLIAVDYAGLVHCRHATTGKQLWSYDVFSAVSSSPLIVGNFVYVADDFGKVTILKLSIGKEPRESDSRIRPIAEMKVDEAVSGSPVFANGVLYIASHEHLWAIGR